MEPVGSHMARVNQYPGKIQLFMGSCRLTYYHLQITCVQDFFFFSIEELYYSFFFLTGLHIRNLGS